MTESDSKLPDKKNKSSTVKHALWIDLNRANVDGRSRLGKSMVFLRKELTEHCGGTLSAPERILIDRIVSKVIKCHLYEMGVLKGQDQGSRDHYLALANSLRLDLQALGIKKRSGEVLNLSKYLEVKKEGERNG